MSSSEPVSGGGGDGEPEPPTTDEFLEGGSIAWDDLAATAFGAFVTTVLIGAAEFLNLVSTGLVAYAETAGAALGGVLSRPFTAGEAAFSVAFAEAASALPALGIFAFPIAVAISLATFLLLIAGVSQLVG